MIAANIIAKKRDGCELTVAEIQWFVRGFVDGYVADYQMSALAMAICVRGMSVTETVALTRQMLGSGATLPDSGACPRVDKHSTGGLGDKTSLILAPALACCGVHVPMISGRGLGITGGTLDKLESIPGFQSELTVERIQTQLEQVGCVICGASDEIAPADRKLYALRDVTGTVESVPLITASILSKKLAESIHCLVLDVKFGSGAFMETVEQARELAVMLVRVGSQMGVRTRAILTDMNQPLGRMVGNAVEVQESIDVLRGDGPDDVRSLTITLGGSLLWMSGVAATESSGQQAIARTLDDGTAWSKFQEMVILQGGELPQVASAGNQIPIVANSAGRVTKICGRMIGNAMTRLGGGRQLAGDPIDHRVGVEMRVKLGQSVRAGDPWLIVLADATLTNDLPGTIKMLESAVTIEAEPSSFTAGPLISEVIDAPG